MNHSEEERAVELLRIDRQLLFEERAGCRKPFLFSLAQISQRQIVVNARVVRVQFNRFFEFADSLVEIAGLAVSAPEKNVKLGGRAHIVQDFVEEKFGLSQLMLTKVGESKRIRGVKISFDTEGGMQVFGGRCEIALRELDVAQQLQSSNIAWIGFDHRSGLDVGLIQMPRPKIDQAKIDTRIGVGRIDRDRFFQQTDSLVRIILLRSQEISR